MTDIYRIERWEDIYRDGAQYGVTDFHDDNRGIGALAPVNIDVEAGALALCIYRDPEADSHDHDKPCNTSVAMFKEALEAAIQS